MSSNISTEQLQQALQDPAKREMLAKLLLGAGTPTKRDRKGKRLFAVKIIDGVHYFFDNAMLYPSPQNKQEFGSLEEALDYRNKGANFWCEFTALVKNETGPIPVTESALFDQEVFIVHVDLDINAPAGTSGKTMANISMMTDDERRIRTCFIFGVPKNHEQINFKVWREEMTQKTRDLLATIIVDDFRTPLANSIAKNHEICMRETYQMIPGQFFCFAHWWRGYAAEKFRDHNVGKSIRDMRGVTGQSVRERPAETGRGRGGRSGRSSSNGPRQRYDDEQQPRRQRDESRSFSSGGRGRGKFDPNYNRGGRGGRFDRGDGVDIFSRGNRGNRRGML